MKVLIDEGLSTLQQLGGIGYFSLTLWEHVKKYIECDITNYHFLKAMPRVAKRVIYFGLANLEPHKQKYDIIHYQNYYVPHFLGKTKGIVTIHDLGGLKSPEAYPVWYNAYFRKVLSDAVRRSDAITLASYAAQEELFSFFPDINKARVHVCHHGLRSIFFRPTQSNDDLTAVHLEPYSYFLFVGNLERRKNITFMLSQFVAARKRSLISPETKLVLIGKLIGYEDFRHLISERDNIFYLGRLEEEQLVTLYKYCKAFVFPSLYEGFGVPIIEAMSQKVPILISNIPSSLEFNHRHHNQCFVFDLGRDNTFVEMLSYLDKNFESVASKLNYGDLSIYSYDYVAKEHIKVYTQVLES